MKPFIVALHGWLVGVSLPAAQPPFQYHRVSGFAIPTVTLPVCGKAVKTELHGYIGMLGPLAPLLQLGLNTSLLDPRLIDSTMAMSSELSKQLWWLTQNGILEYRTFEEEEGLTMHQPEPGFYCTGYDEPVFIGDVPEAVRRGVCRLAHRVSKDPATEYPDSQLAIVFGKLQDLGLIHDDVVFTTFNATDLVSADDGQ